MHPLISRAPLLLLLAGCTAETHDSSTEHGATTDEHGSTAHAHESSSTHAHDSTDATTSTTGEASETGHAHPTETGHEHTSGSESSSSGGDQPPTVAYCECMVLYCHDDYHGTWGEDHEMSEAMCEAAAAALPSVGMPATEGNSLECRAHHCDLARTDPAACASAIGGGSCM